MQSTNENPGLNQDPDFIRAIVANQTRELEIRAQSLALDKQKDDNALEFSKKALDLKLRDRTEIRAHQRSIFRYLIVAAIVGVLAITGIVISAMFMNKDQVAMEIIKGIFFTLCGGAGGYGIGKSKSGDQGPSESES